MHLFSAAPDLVRFGGRACQKRSNRTSLLLGQLFEGLQAEGLAMPFTMEDFVQQYVEDHFARLTPKRRARALKKLPPEERLAGLSADEIRQYLERLAADPPAPTRKPRRKK